MGKIPAGDDITENCVNRNGGSGSGHISVAQQKGCTRTIDKRNHSLSQRLDIFLILYDVNHKKTFVAC